MSAIQHHGGSPENIRVVVRIRPLNKRESKQRDVMAVRPSLPAPAAPQQQPHQLAHFGAGTNGGSTGVEVETGYQQGTVYQCSLCLGPDSTQQQVFDGCGVQQLVNDAIAGYRTTAFAYGQTGAGKTFTMIGGNASIARPNEAWGLLPRALLYIEQRLAEETQRRRMESPSHQEWTFAVRLSCVEIYNENVYDLFVENELERTPLHVREHKQHGFFIEGCRMVPCATYQQASRALEWALQQRRIGNHRLNNRSNRSHCLITVHVDGIPSMSAYSHQSATYGRISFIDLAGSERLKETKSVGQTVKEAGFINKSLYVLGKVIRGLTSTRMARNTATRTVPYRDSKLTKLLIDSLGGTCRTLVLSCVSSASSAVTETMRTLSFSVRVRGIRNKPLLYLDPQEQALQELRQEVQRLREENNILRHHVSVTATGSNVAAPPASHHETTGAAGGPLHEASAISVIGAPTAAPPRMTHVYPTGDAPQQHQHEPPISTYKLAGSAAGAGPPVGLLKSRMAQQKALAAAYHQQTGAAGGFPSRRGRVQQNVLNVQRHRQGRHASGYRRGGGGRGTRRPGAKGGRGRRGSGAKRMFGMLGGRQQYRKGAGGRGLRPVLPEQQRQFQQHHYHSPSQPSPSSEWGPPPVPQLDSPPTNVWQTPSPQKSTGSGSHSQHSPGAASSAVYAAQPPNISPSHRSPTAVQPPTEVDAAQQQAARQAVEEQRAKVKQMVQQSAAKLEQLERELEEHRRKVSQHDAVVASKPTGGYRAPGGAGGMASLQARAGLSAEPHMDAMELGPEDEEHDGEAFDAELDKERLSTLEQQVEELRLELRIQTQLQQKYESLHSNSPHAFPASAVRQAAPPPQYSSPPPPQHHQQQQQQQTHPVVRQDSPTTHDSSPEQHFTPGATHDARSVGAPSPPPPQSKSSPDAGRYGRNDDVARSNVGGDKDGDSDGDQAEDGDNYSEDSDFDYGEDDFEDDEDDREEAEREEATNSSSQDATGTTQGAHATPPQPRRAAGNTPGASLGTPERSGSKKNARYAENDAAADREGEAEIADRMQRLLAGFG